MVNNNKWAFVNRDGQRILKMACPSCGQWQDLMDHSTDEHGQVVPSVECGNGCGFHDLVILIGFPNNPYQGRTF